LFPVVSTSLLLARLARALRAKNLTEIGHGSVFAQTPLTFLKVFENIL
jgi:hypothetical protein